MSESSSYNEINSNNNNSTGSTDSNNSCSSRTSNKVCNECSEPYESLPWCYKCDLPKYSDNEYGSCNPEVDRLIEEAQEKLREKDSSYFFQWIPFNKFKDFQKIGEGGFGSVFKATFTDRSITDTARIVALKCIKTSTTKGSCADFLEEVKIHVLCSLEFDTFLKIYGMTKNPKTLEYMMVTAYANRGNLRDYLEYNFKRLKWTEKLNYLANIATDLDTLHTKEFVHKDLHTGNILQHSPSNGEKIISYLTDFGLTKAYKDKTSPDTKIYGILPYVAPEILLGKKYTKESDIYSFGIIMAEVSSGKRPFGNKPHDSQMTLEIVNGSRPDFGNGTPQCYKDLAERCLDKFPKKRPTAKQLAMDLYKWSWSISDKPLNDIGRDFLASDEYIANSGPSKGKLHPEAIYVSRFIKFPKIENVDNDTSDSDDDDYSTRDSKIVNLRVSNIIKEPQSIQIPKANEESFEELSNSPESLKSPRSPGSQGFDSTLINLTIPNICSELYETTEETLVESAIPNFSSNQLRTVIETEENSQIDSQEGLTLSAVLNKLSLEDKEKYKINDEEGKEKYKINEEEVSLIAISRSLDSKQLELYITSDDDDDGDDDKFQKNSSIETRLNDDDITESHQSSDVPGEVDKNLEIIIVESE